MSSDTNVSDLFLAASRAEPLPAAKPAAKSSCCGPKPEASTGADATATAVKEAAPKASSCCGPKPEASATASEAAPKAKSSCCG